MSDFRGRASFFLGLNSGATNNATGRSAGVASVNIRRRRDSVSGISFGRPIPEDLSP